MQKVQTIRNAEYYNMLSTFDKLYEKSDKNEGFKNLIKLITSRNNILLAYRNLKNNKGSMTKGIDKRNIKDIEQMNEDDLVNLIQQKFEHYQPQRIRRKYIPKKNGKLRPLGIPTILDRLIQMCIAQILDPICEAKFHESSHAFRPCRSVENAIAQCYHKIHHNKLFHVVSIDIKGFFDNVNHNKLMNQLRAFGIKDKKLLKIIKLILSAEIVDKDKVIKPSKGTPQGGVLSPLLSNVVLNELDWWISNQWETYKYKNPLPSYYKERQGSIDKSGLYKKLRKSTKLKEIQIVRYADDFKIFCRTKNHAVRIYHGVIQWLRERLKLEVSQEKSSIVDVRKQSFDFLGFKIGTRKKGLKPNLKKLSKKNKKEWKIENKNLKHTFRYAVKSNVDDTNMKTISKSLKEKLSKIVNPHNVNDQRRKIALYNYYIMGIHNYYNLATEISQDFNKIGYPISKIIKAKFKSDGLTKEGEITNPLIKQKYAKSKQMRFIGKNPILPISYIKHKNPMQKNKRINKYTSNGRELIHKNLTINYEILNAISIINHGSRSVEYIDNKIAKYLAQKGKCWVTGLELNLNEIHCHHIVPYVISKDDTYQNLVIIHKDVHKIVHMTDILKINHIINTNKSFTKQEIQRINKLRKSLNLQLIA